jgi:D-3-phosphoglycerate dehydrogenase / 2-oxoglutarate reductase
MTLRQVSIIGDRFMRSDYFERALIAKCQGLQLDIRKHDMAWPDEHMEHGYAVSGMDGLKEYMGTLEDTIALAKGAEVVITQLAPFSALIMDALPQLKLIAVSRGGPVNIDMTAAKARGIQVVNTPGRNASAVAEFTIGMMLAETRNIAKGHDGLRGGVYRGDLYRADVTGRELSEMTVGIIGYGQVGSRVVKLLKAFGCRILVCDPFTQLSAQDLNDGVVQCSFEQILAEADVVSLHQRVTPETTGMMNRENLLKMKKDAVLVNTARGPLMDYDALYEVLKAGHLRGAALETFAIEPVPPDLPLLQLPNVTLTPHIAGASVKTVTYAADLAADAVNRYLTGQALINLC